MKKTLLALVVAAVAASSANATVIYEKDGTKIDLDGRLHFELLNQKDKRTDLVDVGSRVRVRAFQDIGGGFTAFGGAELRFSKTDGSSSSWGADFRTHRLFAGFSHKDVGSLSFGSQLVLGDHIPKANYTQDLGGNVFLDGHKKAAHFMSASFQGLRIAADYYFGNSNKNTSTGNSDGATKWNEGQGYGLGLFYDRKWDKFTFRFGSGFTEITQSTDGTKANEFKLKRAGVGFDVKYDIVTFGLDWAHGKASKNAESANIGFQKIANAKGPFNQVDRFLVGLKFDVTKQNTVYAQYYFGTGKKAAANAKDVKMNAWALGATHSFNKFVTVYLEGGAGQVKQQGTDTFKNRRIAAGANILF